MTRAAGSAARPPSRRLGGGRLYDYWCAARASPNAELGRIVEGLVPAWWMVLWSVGIAAVAAVILHLVLAVLLRASSGPAQAIVLIAIAGVAVGIIVLFRWLQRHTRLDPTRTSPYAVTLLVSAVAIVVAGQAFAALSVYLAGDGGADDPTLLAAEEAYAWRLLDAVPFLEITGTLGWTEPDALQDGLSGALMLVFAVAIIAPAIRLGFSVYHLLEKLRRDGARSESSVAFGRGRITPETASGAFLVGSAVVGALYFLASYLFDSASRPNRWLDGRVRDDAEIPAGRVSTLWAADVSDRLPDEVSWSAIDVPLSWVATLPQWGLAALFLWGVTGLFVVAFLIDVVADGPRWRLVGPLGAYACLVLVVVELWSAATLVLLHSDLLSTNRALPPGDELRSTIVYYVWHAADAIPALDVPQTLNWSLRHEYVGHASDGFLLAFKIAFLTILAFPIMRVVRSASTGGRPEHRQPALVAAQSYAAALLAVERTLDAAAAVVARGPRHATLPVREAAVAAAGSRLEELRTALGDVELLFGAGEIATAADGAARAADRCMKLIVARPDEDAAEALAAAREELTRAANAYRTVAWETVRRAEPVRAG